MPDLNESPDAPSKRTDIGQFKCVCCGLRYWKKNKLIRRAAQCKGVRYTSGHVRWRCKAWRCRYNDQCPEANSACPICGAFKPPEFQSVQPPCAPDQNSPTHPVQNPYTVHDPADASSSSSSANVPVTHQSPRPESTMRQEPVHVFQRNVPSGQVTLLPLLEGMTQRFLTEV